MRKPPMLTATTTNMSAVFACMDNMALELLDSAETLRTSPLAKVAGGSVSLSAAQMESRADQIRLLVEDIRTTGDLHGFDMACDLAGWRPSQQALQSLQVAH
ncbi:hypothetical protein ACQYZY_26740 [Pseudomonas aeruginosa]|jgi:hypothetical protein|uniref:hypothetical protein n=1 Tax=Pseudomonas aeruginosa TaxID=287 RepID=UPI001A32A2CD|nr:hypothetical protein [Pseudomonas aeruginosa]MBH4318852.1 hypothetical protein [Pseudomonas aeruginosa]MBH8701057.1 hypothetical protein [Pseudomonas aeruginosa]WBM10842.1 hypothetical protein M1V28_31040 [Pseudomonas aeruginosa]HEK3610457.1 hypothetical protein [Pseudomonas aeruginosa]